MLTTNLQRFCHIGRLLYPFILGGYVVFINLRNLNKIIKGYGRVKLDAVITINNKLVENYENAITTEEIGIAELMLESTLFHESVHVGLYTKSDGKYGGAADVSRNIKDQGEAFEKKVYGIDVEPINVKELYKKMNSNDQK